VGTPFRAAEAEDRLPDADGVRGTLLIFRTGNLGRRCFCRRDWKERFYTRRTCRGETTASWTHRVQQCTRWSRLPDSVGPGAVLPARIFLAHRAAGLRVAGHDCQHARHRPNT
jgi:hypothetical protein